VKNVVITISEEYLEKMDVLAEIWEKSGLHITQKFEFGVITAQAEDDLIKLLKEKKEIISLTEDKEVSISPPDSNIQ